ncbi:MAG TPA: HAD-IA family hydrolase [Bacteroidota bacterium]|nr:HAD-IA family hydrolase [Bacteroidota bacterium]
MPRSLPHQTKTQVVAGVIFDCDGTLTRTNELIFATFNHITSKYCGRTYAPSEIIALFGPPEEGAIVRFVGEHRLAEAMDELCTFYRKHHREMAGLHPGIEDVLRYLKSREIPLGVFTGKGRRTIAITLEELGIASYFDMVISGNDVQRHKPDPEGIEKFVRAFRLDPAEVLMVGDAMGDITAARGAGVVSVAVLWDSYDRARIARAGAHLLFDDVPSFHSWLTNGVHYVPLRRDQIPTTS